MRKSNKPKPKSKSKSNKSKPNKYNLYPRGVPLKEVETQHNESLNALYEEELMKFDPEVARKNIDEAKKAQERTRTNEYVHPELSLDSILNFGKHKGQMLEDVIEDDPSYIEWMIREDVRQFDEEVMQLLEKKGII